jgi:L-ascorbate metabolism protein UlaG (beta-lactamase superfamily)
LLGFGSGYAPRVRPSDLEFSSRELAEGVGQVRLRWLGTAGFEIEHDGWVLLIDPYLTRASLRDCLSRRMVPDLRAIRAHVSGADAIICGHTHFDHVLDVPAIARFSGARVFGSRSAVNLCRAAGIAERQLVDVQSPTGRSVIRAEVGPFSLRFVPSCHSPLLAGRVPYPGDIIDCDQVPHTMSGYRCGAVFGVVIEVAGRRIFHAGSANLDDGAPTDGGVDLLLLCVAGWHTTDRFPERVLRAVSPGSVLLSHWDNFFRPLEHGAHALPAIRFGGLVEQLHAADPSARVGTAALGGDLWL